MGCQSCKNKGNEILSVFKNPKNNENVEVEPKGVVFQIFNFLIRLFIFAISICLTPVIMLFVVYMLFKTVMLNSGEVNLTPTLLKVAKGIGIGKKRVEDEYPEDYEDLKSNNPEEYELDEQIDKVLL